MTQPSLRINEVGLRDGLQNQPRFVSTEDKLRMAHALADAGVVHLEASSFVSPKAVPQMADAELVLAGLRTLAQVKPSALVPNERGLERALQMRVQEIAVVLSATDTMNRRNIRMSLAEALATCQRTVAAAKTAGIRTKAYIAVAFECPFEGATAQGAVLDLLAQLPQADEIVIADTIGAAHPKAVAALMRQCLALRPAGELSIHLHDTRGMAVANAWAALDAGIAQFDSSVGGLGGCPFAPGAAGNLATEDLVLLANASGFATGIDLGKLRAATRMAEGITGLTLGGRSEAYLRRQDAKSQLEAA